MSRRPADSPRGADLTLVGAVRAALAARADPTRAPAMQAYMKSAMPYRGVPTPALRACLRPLYTATRLPSFTAWRSTILALWRGAAFREERYAAIELAGHRFYRAHQTMAALPLYDELIVSGAWWDYVDAIASHLLSAILAAEPAPMRRAMRAWAHGDDLWKRRSAILCQLPCKRDTDLALLADCIEPALGSREFFLRKAIGWALREYAKTDPAWVRRYVRQHAARLSPLSQREALRRIR
ncbi:MAG: DNA alkylation repair protein [Deltaproteobacteria bacterium]|nr:DNA alkylation repair protein [Deltaproteobacteria bacterium]